MAEHRGPRLGRGGPDVFTKLGTALVGPLLSKAVSFPQLRRLAAQLDRIPWTRLERPISETTVALIATTGVHLTGDPPFDIPDHGTFRVLPRDVQAGDVTITQPAYDRRDAQRDLNLVFPIERLRELEAAGVIGRLASEHYGFGLTPNDRDLVAPGREVARRLKREGVDLALFVPA